MSQPLVATPTVIYVVIDDRADFDKIDRPASEHITPGVGHCLAKTVEQAGVLVIFQHWLH